MSKFAVNLSTVFTEVPFIERFKKAKKAGFSYVECQFPYISSIESIKAELERNELSLVLINLPPGNWEKGDRGLASDPNRLDEFHEAVERGIEYATRLDCANIHCMAGVLSSETDRNKAKEIYIENVKYAARRFADHQLTLFIEPINPIDMPGYFLSSIEEAIEIIAGIGLGNVKLQYDFYHLQKIQGGDLITIFKKYIDRIGHVQIADVPGRHEPGTGTMNYERIFEALDDIQYEGFIGLEYIPKGKSEESFAWMRRKG